VVEAAQRRAAEGALEFHDLLVHARHLLATDGRARRRLHQLYQRVLLDEFQDTDPIQLEIAVRLTADPDDAAHEIDWTALRPIPGRLFVVGDPKQSIYRFRRADIAQYLRAADQIGATNVALSTNFRSTRAIIDVTNDVFERLIVEERDVQPAFRALVAGRAEALLDHGTVRVLGREPHLDIADGDYDGDLGRADELRRREAVDVVTTVRSALADGWPVGESTGGVHSIRPCRAGDICILLPTRLSLPALESALRDAGVPYRAENSAMVYTSAEVRAVLLALRAADDPTDELAVVSVLRTTLYGCSDVELLEWKTAGGSWSILRPAPEHLVDHPVACALEHLASLRRRSDTASAAELLTAVIDERRVLDVAFADADARDVWHRLRFVVDHARAWSDAGGHGLRRYLHWARMQGSDGRISEAILPEEDRDTVRVMTVHAAKGLEFPITVLSGMTTQPQGRNGVNVVWDGSAWMLTGRGDDGQFDEYRPIDEQMSDAERRRLLYVACTRAVDHLVVSAHRRADDASSAARRPDRLTSAELLAVVGRITDLALPATPVPTGGAVASTAPTPTAATATPDPHDAARSPATRDAVDWETSYPAVVAAATRRRAVAATRLADEVALRSTADAVVDPGLDKQPVDLSTPPWQRGRYGTAIGRAVHGTLQFCDLATGLDVEPLARSQCAAEGILGHEQHVSALVRSALAAPIVRAAAGGAAHWRELFVVAPVGDRLLEGYVDLLVRSGDGLVIVDYKTDRWSGPVQTGERLARYRLQLAAYAVALGVIVDEPVVGGVLVRCRPDGPADQIELDCWLDAQATVRSLAS
jgi:ATP-dependent helicase/nuclease subunit A